MLVIKLLSLLSVASALVVSPRLAVLPAAPRATAPLMCASSWNSDDDAELHDAIARKSATKLGHPMQVLEGLNSAWVLIFNPGQHDEGVYTLQGRAAPETSSYVLAFETTDDADRFAQLLQAEGFDLATPLCWDVDRLSTFCTVGAFQVSLVPPGGLVTPPTKNEYDMDAFDRLNDEQRCIDKMQHERSDLERMLNMEDNCGDDDCTIDMGPLPPDMDM